MKRILLTIILSFLLCPSFVFAQETPPIENTEVVIPIYFFANEDGNVLGITPISEDSFIWFYPLSEEEAQIAQEAGADVVWQDEILIPYTFTPGTWYHLAITFDGTNDQVKAYVNGSQTGSTQTNVISSIYNTDTNFVIGANGIATSSFLDAKVDDVRVWSGVRTGTDISNDYSTELEGTESNLVSYWKMNDSLLDETTNNNDLTNNNSALFSIDVPFEGTTSTTSVIPTSTIYYLYSGTNYANPHALTTVSTTSSTMDYTYDNNGNLTSYGDWSNVWDYDNRLVSSTNGISTSTYSYDQSGQRVKKTENGVVSVYPNKFYSIENGVIKKHIFAGDLNVASVEGTTTTFHHTDHLSGSSVESDEEGYVTEVLDYYPFGETRLDEKYTTYENDKKFTGHEYDAATDLYYMGARYQNPEIGRFISQDPVFQAIGDNKKLISLLGDNW